METLFDWRKPSINNRLSFFSGFSELKLTEYINEFELATQVYGEKSVNIDVQKYVLKIIQEVTKILSIISSIIKKTDNFKLNGKYDST